MLGTARVILPSTAGSPCYDGDFYPFGGEREYTSTCAENYKFEGKKRDQETGNDDFGARYYSSSFGRWESPDWSSTPEPVPYANLTNPQTLNLYAMVNDNPETFADLDGHCPSALKGFCSFFENTFGFAFQLLNDGIQRGAYSAAVKALAGLPGASEARINLQKKTAKRLSPVGRAVTDAEKSKRAGQLEGKTAAQRAESAARSNERMDAFGEGEEAVEVLWRSWQMQLLSSTLPQLQMGKRRRRPKRELAPSEAHSREPRSERSLVGRLEMYRELSWEEQLVAL